MKLCKDCKHFLSHKGYALCKLASRIEIHPVSGKQSIKLFDGRPMTGYCVDERKDSTGFFGLFKDETRCGVEAKNFEPNDE